MNEEQEDLKNLYHGAKVWRTGKLIEFVTAKPLACGLCGVKVDLFAQQCK